MTTCTVCNCDYEDGSCECTRCSHKWELVPDWIGDPNVIHGTMDASYWRCIQCGDETPHRPDDWEDPREAAAEARWERERDDKLCGWEE